jgi:ribosome-binding protein aMBF1 (putative translation factor)|tara:strand:- start:1954 stop:2283 length:330 start_codon:yes stop_codon:yes gene_type:complete
MEHQDWKPVTLNNNSYKQKNVDKSKIVSQHQPDVERKMEAPSKLGQLICQGRTVKNKNQKLLASELGISVQVLSRWETNKELPSNADIAKIERVLGIKMPRAKRAKPQD